MYWLFLICSIIIHLIGLSLFYNTFKPNFKQESQYELVKIDLLIDHTIISSQPEKAQPEKVQPEKVQPEKVQPEKVQPEKVQPEKVQPEKVQPEKVQPEKVQPEKVQPEKVQPEKVQPEKVQTKNASKNIKSTSQVKTNPKQESQSKTDELTAYKGALHLAIERKKRYPKQAIRMQKQGRVIVKFSLADDGTIHNVSIQTSSNNTLLDRAALKAVLDVKQFSPPPTKLKRTLHIPIDFKL